MFRKPRADVYTALLFVALVALVLGAVVAFFEIQDYGESPFQGGPSVSAAAGNVEGIAMNEGLRTKDKG